MPGNMREDLIETIQTLSDEDVAAVLDYISFFCGEEEEEPTDSEIQAIVAGREEYARGEYVKWGETGF